MLRFTAGLEAEIVRASMPSSTILEAEATKFNTPRGDFPPPSDVVAHLNRLESSPMRSRSGDLVAEHWPLPVSTNADELYVLREKGGLARPMYAVRVKARFLDAETVVCKVCAYAWDDAGGLKFFHKTKMVEWMMRRIPNNEADLKEFILWVLAGLTDRDHRTSHVRPFRNVVIRAPIDECVNEIYKSGRLPGFAAALLYSRGELDASSEEFWRHPDREKDVPDAGKTFSTRGLCKRFIVDPRDLAVLRASPADLRPEGCGDPWKYRVSFCHVTSFGCPFGGLAVGGLRGDERVMRPFAVAPWATPVM